jgi:hypothetical protein
MSPHELRDELDQLILRLESGASLNAHLREVASWLSMKVSSVAFDERFASRPVPDAPGATRTRQRVPGTTAERLRESDIQDAYAVLHAAADGRLLPNAAARLRNVLQYLPPAAPATATTTTAAAPTPPDVVRRHAHQYRVQSHEAGYSATVVEFVHRLGDVRPAAHGLRTACAERGIDPSAFDRIVAADAEALGRAHLSTRNDTRADVLFSHADGMLPLLLARVADEERAAPVPNAAVARLVDELTAEALPALNPAFAATDVDSGPAWAAAAHRLRVDRVVEIASTLGMAATQRGVDLGAFERLIGAVTRPPPTGISAVVEPQDVAPAFAALASLRRTPLPAPPAPTPRFPLPPNRRPPRDPA